jgi:CPA1 family monovalent cation:H+ antiporter
LSLLTPFAAFLLAQAMDCSGVVAVLVSALVLAYSGPVVIRARSRLKAYGFWDIATFLLNGSLWVFVGVQIPGALRGIAGVDGGVRHATYIALAVTGVVIGSRIVWGEVTTWLIRGIDRRAVQRERRAPWRQRFVIAWAGFRGAVSLAAALAVPATTLSGAPFPDRSLLIFIVIFVILVTVLVQGSTLPAVVRWARMPDDATYAEELELARKRGSQAALEALPVVAAEVGVSGDLLKKLQKQFEDKAALVLATEDGSANDHLVKSKELVRRVRLGVLEHKRRAITALRNQNLIDDIVLRELQEQMDLEEVQLLNAVESD